MVNKTKRKANDTEDINYSSKEKKKRTAPTNTSLLPPCKVCEQPAAGFHYGVNTCEACKGFFRRTLVRGGEYACIGGDGKCDVVGVAQNGKSRICPHCRHNKCLAVGMSQEAIKTGRYTHAKRTQDIIEYRQALGKTDNSSEPSPQLPPVPSPSPRPYITTTTATTTTSPHEDINKDVISNSTSALNNSRTSIIASTLHNSNPTSIILNNSPNSLDTHLAVATETTPVSLAAARNRTRENVNVIPAAPAIGTPKAIHSLRSSLSPFSPSGQQSSVTETLPSFSSAMGLQQSSEAFVELSQAADLQNPSEVNAKSLSPDFSLSWGSQEFTEEKITEPSLELSPAAGTQKPSLVKMTGTSLDFSPLSQDGSSQPHYTTLSPARLGLTATQDFSLAGTVSMPNGSSMQGEARETAIPPNTNTQNMPSPFSLMDNIFHKMDGESRPLVVETPPPSQSDSPVSGVPLSSSLDKKCDVMSDEECRRLTQHLVESHEEHHMFQNCLSPEEVLKKQVACYENCLARVETFGPMGSVSETEYQEFYQSTGIDVDNRQNFFTLLSKLLDENIRIGIAFVKTIPGFSDLKMKDQMRLLKDNRCEVGVICQSRGYNYKLRVMTLPSGGCFCQHDLEKLGGKERAELRHQVLKDILKLKLEQREKIIFKCMILFTVGPEDVEEPEKVSAVQWKMAQCLLWLLKENKRPNPNLFFAKIINTFLRIKTMASHFYEWIKSRPFEHYAQFRNNELLAEWFTNS